MFEIEISRTGEVTTLHDDAVMPLVIGVGEAHIARASHVEPDGLAWAVYCADGRDTGERFGTREAALAWERANWKALI